MGKRTEIVLLVTVLSLVVTIIMQGSIFDTTKAIRHGLTNVAAAITYLQHNGKTLNRDILQQPNSPVTQQYSETNQTQLENIALPSTIRTTNLTTIFKQVENSVVQITAKTSNPNLQIIINGNQLRGQSTRLGSGFVYDKQGHILTNNHVIDGASTADVTFVDGNTYRAKVIGKDPSSDIALLQITDNFSPENLVPLPIVNSSSLQVGQQVIAIGNPFGLSDTMTTGIV
ncbi:MAG TPA: trypsin-like peptidase domain-containing protein, partial [Bacteroidia bacterium]|nr:trypsin-like peptidase domain-containing protein [Bacteroidia bacterium]